MKPSLYHEEIGTIVIASERTYKAAKIFWEAIAAQYELPQFEKPIFPEEPPAPKTDLDAREENLARSTIPSDEIKPVKAKKPAKKGKRGGNHNKGNKYGIPSSMFATDRQKYQRLWSRCKKLGIMYEDALKLEGKTVPRGIHKKSAAKKVDPQTINEPAEKTSEEASRIDKPPSDIKIEGAAELVDKMPEVRPPSGLQEKRLAATGFKLKDHVRQIKKFNDRQASGVGVVTGFKNGLVEVNFSGTQYYKIAPDCLEVV